MSSGDITTLRPWRNARYFADDIFKHIFFNEKVQNFIQISLKFVPKFQIGAKPTSVLIMTWCQTHKKPLSEPMMVYLTEASLDLIKLQWCYMRVMMSQITGHLTVYPTACLWWLNNYGIFKALYYGPFWAESRMAPRHYLDQCSLIKGVLWHSPASNCTRSPMLFQ